MMDNDRLDDPPAKLLAVDVDGALRHLPRNRLSSLFCTGDLVVANDAATLPASLVGHHCASGERIEVRLAAWVSPHNPREFAAIAFGSGDHRTPTEDRPPPPPLAPGDRLTLGPLTAVIERLLDHPRLFRLRFLCDSASILAGLAQHGRPIQYAHVPKPLALWDVWTRIAADPIAFEAPSAGFALDWRMLAAWRLRGIGFTTLTHAAGISSTGDPALDARLPFDEPYHIPEQTVAAIAHARSLGSRIIAVGTSVVRALESAADADGGVLPGHGVATGRIGRQTSLRIVDALLTGVHQVGDSHFELLRAFASDTVLASVSGGFRTHNYQPSRVWRLSPDRMLAKRWLQGHPIERPTKRSAQNVAGVLRHERIRRKFGSRGLRTAPGTAAKEQRDAKCCRRGRGMSLHPSEFASLAMTLQI